jgi:hypothetical protein
MDPQKTYWSEATRRCLPIRAVFPTPEFAALHSQMFVRHLHTDGASVSSDFRSNPIEPQFGEIEPVNEGVNGTIRIVLDTTIRSAPLLAPGRNSRIAK